MDMNCDEEKALDQKVSMRLGLILQREDKGRKDHSDEKAAKIRNLSDRQVKKDDALLFHEINPFYSRVAKSKNSMRSLSDLGLTRS